MARRFDYPTDAYPDAWVELPDVWKGLHAERRDDAVRQSQTGSTLTQFGVSLAIADDWKLPGLNGNPDQWDFEELDLAIIAWVNQVTAVDFAKSFIVPKG